MKARIPARDSDIPMLNLSFKQDSINRNSKFRYSPSITKQTLNCRCDPLNDNKKSSLGSLKHAHCGRVWMYCNYFAVIKHDFEPPKRRNCQTALPNTQSYAIFPTFHRFSCFLISRARSRNFHTKKLSLAGNLWSKFIGENFSANFSLPLTSSLIYFEKFSMNANQREAEAQKNVPKAAFFTSAENFCLSRTIAIDVLLHDVCW